MNGDTQVLPDRTATEQRGLQTAELSNAMVRIYKEQFGRGPTKAHSTYATTDLLICTLEESLTPAERRMAKLGEHQRVRDIRTFFQHASEKEFVETVEQITGRRVRAFVSGTDTHQDVSSEVFYFEPVAGAEAINGGLRAMSPFDVVLGPWRAIRVLARAAEDLSAVAERARRDPDPVEEARERLDALFTELETLIVAIRAVDASALALGTGGEDLLVAARSLDSTARAIETGGRELRRTGEVLDEHTQELIDGGQDLTAVAKDLADSLRVLRVALPRLLEGLDSVEQLEESVETVAETVEPLQGVAKGVGRVSNRLSRQS